MRGLALRARMDGGREKGGEGRVVEDGGERDMFIVIASKKVPCVLCIV